MSDTNETIADIIAEMRGADNKCQLATKDGTGCYHCPFGSAASNCVFDNYADRLEAAHRREVATTKESLAVGNSGDCAKLREALGNLRAELWNNTVIAGKRKFGLYEIADAALAAPPRNCDLPEVAKDPWRAWLDDKSNWDEFGSPKLEIHDWLLAPATEKEGGAK